MLTQFGRYANLMLTQFDAEGNSEFDATQFDRYANSEFDRSANSRNEFKDER